MPAREPFKPISIHKKLGEIYFDEKCHLIGSESAPTANSFKVETAKSMLMKYKDAKKPVKMKITGLADSLKLEKGSKLGKKLPYSKIKYSEVKIHKVFSQAKNVLVLGVQGSDSSKKYMVIIFEQPMKAARLDGQLEYADEAPKNNLKNRIIIVDSPSVRQPSPEYQNLISPQPPSEPSHQLHRDALTENSGRSQEVPIIQETGLPRENYDMSPQPSVDVPLSQATGLPKQAVHSPNPMTSPSPPPMPPRSSSPTVLRSATKQLQSETAIDPANQQQGGALICSRCRSMREELISTATSPINLLGENSRADLASTSVSIGAISSRSSSRSQSHSKIFTRNKNSSRSLSRSWDKTPLGNSSRSMRSNSMTSNSSHRTMTTDASSHYVLEDERNLFDRRPQSKEELRVQQQSQQKEYLISRDTIVVRDESPDFKPQRRRSSSSTKLLKHKKSKSKREHRPKSMVATARSPIQIYSSSPNNRNTNVPLFILATGKFKPFSEFSHEHNVSTHGICSICGKEGEGDPRQVEIIRTDSSGGPVISDDGCIYMYSTTQPVEYANGYGTHQKQNKPRKHRRRSSNSSSSSSSGESQMKVAPVSVYRSAQKNEVYQDKRKKWSTTSPDPQVMELHIPAETSRHHSHGRKESHQRDSKHRSSLSVAELLMPVGSVANQKVPLAPESYVTQEWGHYEHRMSSTSSTKKKIYRLESSDSDSSSTFTEESDLNRSGNIKVTPLRF